jgi:hypothetical protein
MSLLKKTLSREAYIRSVNQATHMSIASHSYLCIIFQN